MREHVTDPGLHPFGRISDNETISLGNNLHPFGSKGSFSANPSINIHPSGSKLRLGSKDVFLKDGKCPLGIPSTCDRCNLSFVLLSDLEAHKQHEHNKHFIPQYDGPGQDVFEIVDITDTSNRTAGFTFNQDKQTEKIKKDAQINDYEVNINNNDENATIKCSTGFYIQVARASFVTLEKHSVISRGRIAITVDNVTITKDQSGVESTRLYHFSFMSELKSHGGVTLHLHHSTRTIQVQGSHIMPDSSRAALWFVNNTILIRFRDQAKAKNFAIKSYNDAVLKHNPNKKNEHINSCQSCFSVFNTKSKPSQCDYCANYFHKTSCLRDHMKTCTEKSANKHRKQQSSRNESSSIASPQPSSLSVPAVSESSCPRFPGLQTSVTFIPDQPSSSSRIQTSSQVVRLSTPSTSNTSPLPMLSVPASSPPIAPTPATFDTSALPMLQSVPIPPISKASTKPIGKKKHKSPFPTSDVEAKAEFLQTELNAAKARIVQLDASIEDKDRRVSVLMARLKIFEDKQNKDVFDKYFPAEPNQQERTANLPPNNPTVAPSCTTSRPGQPCSYNPPPSSRCSYCSCCPPSSLCSHHRTHIHQDSHTCHCSSSCLSPATKESYLKDSGLEKLNNKIDTININTEVLKSLIEETMKPINTTNKKTVNVNNFHKEQTENTTKEANEINLDESTASIEEYISEIPDLPDNSSPKQLPEIQLSDTHLSQQQLNFLLPTNHLL